MSSFNKAEVTSLLVKQMCKGELLPPAGHGGEGVERLISTRSPSRGRSSWRLRDPALCHGIGRSPATLLVKPSRWRRDAGGEAGEVLFFSNK
jgi:hypothetical protein